MFNREETMSCNKIRACFDERVDGRLAPEGQRQFDAHVASCANCRHEWEAYAASWQTLARPLAIEPSFGFVERTLRRLEEPASVITPGLWRLQILRWAMVASVVIVAGIGGWHGWQRGQEASHVLVYASVQQSDVLDEDFDVIATLDQLSGASGHRGGKL